MPPTQSGLIGLYLERACANVEVQLNGQQLHAAGRTIDPISLDCQRPLLLPLPAALLQAGKNTLDLRLSGYALRQVASHQRAGALAAPLIGDYAALAARDGRDRLLAVTLPTVASALLLLTALLALVVARSSRRDSHLLYFAGLATGWALVTARLWWHDLPLSNFDSELLLACLPPLVALAAVQFLIHYAGWRSRPIEVALVRAMRRRAGQPAAGRPAARAHDRQFLVRAAGAAGAGRDGVLPVDDMAHTPA